MSFMNAVITFMSELEKLPPVLRTNAREIIADLSAKGDCNAIAAYLERIGITGNTSEEYTCPIANYLKSQLASAYSISVSGDEIVIHNGRDGAEDESITPPANIKEFITNFDNGEYPELQTMDDDDEDEDDDYDDEDDWDDEDDDWDDDSVDEDEEDEDEE